MISTYVDADWRFWLLEEEVSCELDSDGTSWNGGTLSSWTGRDGEAEDWLAGLGSLPDI